MLFLKFGKQEHLEQLRNGVVHFRPIEFFQNEPTSYRGDPMEGKIYIDNKLPFLIDGVDISSFIEKVTASCQISGNIFSFSASKLSKNVCKLNEDGTYSPNEGFISEMMQFGDSFLLFNGFEFIDQLEGLLDEMGCPAESHSITYCDKQNHKAMRENFKDIAEEDARFRYFFIKDQSYAMQNEWRIVIYDIDGLLAIDENGGVNLQTGFSTDSPVYKAEALSTLKCSGVWEND